MNSKQDIICGCEKKISYKSSTFNQNVYSFITIPTFIAKKIFPEQAKSIYKKALIHLINKQNTISDSIYIRELEESPITINITNDNKIQLLDGYKRLLYINDESLLRKEVPVKVFYNLCDKDFLTYLYAMNYWKINVKNVYPPAAFHDRGCLFALKQRFNINYSEELKIFLRLYDNIEIRDISRELSIPFFIATPEHNEHLINDAKICTDVIKQIKSTHYSYQDNIRDYMLYEIIGIIGFIRHTNNEKQLEIIPELFDKIMLDKDIVKIYSNKSYTSDVYIKNSFHDNHIFDKIKETIYKTLTSVMEKQTNTNNELEKQL